MQNSVQKLSNVQEAWQEFQQELHAQGILIDLRSIKNNAMIDNASAVAQAIADLSPIGTPSQRAQLSLSIAAISSNIAALRVLLESMVALDAIEKEVFE